jgi:hypothetical protein
MNAAERAEGGVKVGRSAMLEQVFRPLIWLLSISEALDAALALAVGVFLVFFRRWHRGVYGLGEILFGMALAGFAVITISPADLSALDFNASDAVTVAVEVSVLQFFTAVFVVVRGLDNIRQWLDDPAA